MFELLGLLLIGLGIFIVLVGAWVIFTYNYLIMLQQRISNAWAQIDVQLKRRYDLIPNLVETVKGYAKHEKETLTKIAELRSQLISGTPAERVHASNLLSETLKSLFAVAENYPDLKASQNFLLLQEELAGTENKISYVRTSYNDAVMLYNTAIKSFPTNILASIFNFKEVQYLEIPQTERENVKVKFE